MVMGRFKCPIRVRLVFMLELRLGLTYEPGVEEVVHR